MQKIIRQLFIPAMMLMFLIPQDMSGQTIRERIEARIKRRAEERMARKAEKEADKVLDEVEEAIDKKQREDKARKGTSDSGSEPSDVEVIFDEDQSPDPNVEPSSFIGSFSMETHELKNGKEDKNSPIMIHYVIDAYQFSVQIENNRKNDDDVTMIYDRRDRSVTMLDEKEKSAIITKIPKMRIKVTYDETESEDFKLEATGRTKTIEGFLCKEYAFDTEEQSGTLWVTEEASMDYRQMGQMFGMVQVQGKGAEGFHPAASEIMNGAIIESHMLDKKNGRQIDTYMKNWKEGSVSEDAFDLSDYEVQDMRNLMNIFKN